MRLTNQKYQILNHLQSGKKITPLEALDQFGCMRLASRINELRDEGYPIETKIMSDKEKRWAEYSLDDNATQQ
jgi:hypothetical protein